MRVLVPTTAGSGHLGPLVPFATALRDGGHDVVRDVFGRPFLEALAR